MIRDLIEKLKEDEELKEAEKRSLADNVKEEAARAQQSTALLAEVLTRSASDEAGEAGEAGWEGGAPHDHAAGGSSSSDGDDSPDVRES